MSKRAGKAPRANKRQSIALPRPEERSCEALANEVISRQTRSVRIMVGYTIALVTIGFGTIIATLLFAPQLMPEFVKTSLTAGGTFVSSLGTLPLAQVMSKRENVAMLRSMIARLRALGERTDVASQQDFRRIEDLLWKRVEKAVGV